MLFSDPLKRNKLLFWLAVSFIAVAVLEFFAITTSILPSSRQFPYYGLIILGWIDNVILCIASIFAAILFLLCTLGTTANHQRAKQYTIGFTAYSVAHIICGLYSILFSLMNGSASDVLRILRLVLCALYATSLVIITVFLFTRKYQPWPFTAFCVIAGAWIAYCILSQIVNLDSNLSLWDIIWALIWVLRDAIPVIFIAITLRTGCYFPPEMRLRQLMSMRAAGKLDEVSYQEQRAEVIENL